MATLKTYSQGAGTNLRKFSGPSMGSRDDRFRTDLAAVLEDLATGCAAGATITGPTRTLTGGHRVIVEGTASAAGTVTIETSSDGGTTWPSTDSGPVLASEFVVGSAVTLGGANRYRVKFTCGPDAASKVAFYSQARA